MFWDEEITQEEEDEIIEWIAREFYKYGLEPAGIMFLESLKPISRYGSSMGQIFISPMLPILGDNLMMKGDKAMRVLERDENVEKLIQRLEDMAVNGVDNEKETKEEPSNKEDGEVVTEEKKGWRRLIPF